MVFLRSAPSASSGRFVGSIATAPGAYPRARRRIMGPKTPARATESSTRRAIGRSPIRNASAMPDKTFERILIFIRDRFAGAVRAGHHQHIRSAGGKEQVTGAACRATSLQARRYPERRRRVPASSEQAQSAERSIAAALPPQEKVRPGFAPFPDLFAITANGFSFRNFRSRKAALASGFRASQAR